MEPVCSSNTLRGFTQPICGVARGLLSDSERKRADRTGMIPGGTRLRICDIIDRIS